MIWGREEFLWVASWMVTLQIYVMNASLYSCCLRFSKQEQILYPGEPNNGNFRYVSCDFWDRSGKFWKWHCLIKINDLGVILLRISLSSFLDGNAANLRNECFSLFMLSFVFQSKSRHFTRGSQTMEIFDTSIVTFETEVAIFENDIASSKLMILVSSCWEFLWVASWMVTLQIYVMNASLYSCCLRFSKQEQTLYPGGGGGGKQWKFSIRQLWLLRQKWHILKMTLSHQN